MTDIAAPSEQRLDDATDASLGGHDQTKMSEIQFRRARYDGGS